MIRSRPPSFGYGVVLLLGAVMVIFQTITHMNDNYFGVDIQRMLAAASLYSLNDAAEYTYFQPSTVIDKSIENRARENTAKCSRILLYLPGTTGVNGQGCQLNLYTMGALTATYDNRAMVLAEPPIEESGYGGGSQFGCPIDMFRETMTETSSSSIKGRGERGWQIRDDFPLGFSRMIEHPAWLSNGCPMPCADTHGYLDWEAIYDRMIVDKLSLEEITCQNADGTEVSVMVTAGIPIRHSFKDLDAKVAQNHPSPEAEQWALRLGATSQEAELFSNTKDQHQVWDFVLGLMNKAGFLKLQPWIARDIELLLGSFDLPMDEDYTAMHIRRGDKLNSEARLEVIKYYTALGYVYGKDTFPTNYVPFAHYLSQWDGSDKCLKNDKGELQVMKHHVYIATDDPIEVHKEIQALPNHVDENTVLWNDCHQLTFHFNPTNAKHFHLNGDRQRGFSNAEDQENDTCFMRYHRNIVSIADLMILAKSRTFIAEFNSNWGRLIRNARVSLNAPVAQSDGTNDIAVDNDLQDATSTLDMRVAWGSTEVIAPGL